jgi:hypothetical protein
MNEKVTKKEFCELAECSKQLIAVYVAKGMPKHPHPENKRKNLFDLEECHYWALEQEFFKFAQKIRNAQKIQKAKNEISNQNQPVNTLVDDDPELQHGEGSTAAPLIVTADPFIELERRFSALTKSLSRRGK